MNTNVFYMASIFCSGHPCPSRNQSFNGFGVLLDCIFEMKIMMEEPTQLSESQFGKKLRSTNLEKDTTKMTSFSVLVSFIFQNLKHINKPNFPDIVNSMCTVVETVLMELRSQQNFKLLCHILTTLNYTFAAFLMFVFAMILEIPKCESLFPQN